MARWTTMTWQGFVAAFRRGQKEGRVSWTRTTLSFLLCWSTSFAVEACESAYRQTLDRKMAGFYVSSVAVVMTLMVLFLGLYLRKPDTKQSEVLLFTWFAVGATAVVLALCIPAMV